jgi:hypothetical protein
VTFVSDVSLDGIVFDGSRFTYGVPLTEYVAILGSPSRSESPGQPAPYGHRNNVIHFFDNLGLLLYEHHATYLIQGITFLLDPANFPFPTSNAYSGKLYVCGVDVRSGMKFNEFAELCAATFIPSIGGYWHLDGKAVSIGIQLVAPSRKRGSRKTTISEVGVDFKGAHRFSVVK